MLYYINDERLKLVPVDAKITPAMIEAASKALNRWAEEYGVDDVPAHESLIRAILIAAQSEG